MKAQEFYEKYEGHYFIYDGEKVRVVGFEGDSDFIIVSGYRNAFNSNYGLDSYVNKQLIKNDDNLWYCSIDGKPFCEFIESDETEIQPCIESISEPISKRFYTACCAMQGIVSGIMQSTEWNGWSDDYIAERSFEIADELLKQENDGKALQ